MMNIKLIKDILLEVNPQIIFLDKVFDKALVGNFKNYNKKYVAVYNSTEYIKILMKKSNLNMIEALDQLHSYIDSDLEDKPIFIQDFREAKEPNI